MEELLSVAVFILLSFALLMVVHWPLGVPACAGTVTSASGSQSCRSEHGELGGTRCTFRLQSHILTSQVKAATCDKSQGFLPKC